MDRDLLITWYCVTVYGQRVFGQRFGNMWIMFGLYSSINVTFGPNSRSEKHSPTLSSIFLLNPSLNKIHSFSTACSHVGSSFYNHTICISSLICALTSDRNWRFLSFPLYRTPHLWLWMPKWGSVRQVGCKTRDPKLFNGTKNLVFGIFARFDT